MPFEKGNKHGSKSREFEKRIRAAIEQDDWKRVRDGIEKTLDRVAMGDEWAMEFVRDAIDGKPKQQVDLGLDTPLTEGLSRFNQLLEDSIAREEAKALAGTGEERSLLPAPVSPTTH